MPIPEKVAFQVGVSVVTHVRGVDPKRGDALQFTGLRPLPRVAKNAYKTPTVGTSQFFNLSLAFRDLSNGRTWVRRTAIMAPGEFQERSRAVRGWEVRSWLVSLLYSFKAAVKIVSKLVED